MVFLINRFGAVTTQIQPPLSQGTVGVETMTIFAPFPSSVVCTVSAQLPNGAYIEPIPAENTTVAGLFKDGQPLSMWVWKPDARITQYAGIVRVQFAFTSGDQRLTTSDVTFRIDGGVPHITPEVDEDDYDTILQILALANLAKDNAYDAMYRAMAWAIGKTVGDVSTIWASTQGDAQIPINKWQYIGKIGIDRAEQVAFVHENSGWKIESSTSVIASGVNLDDYGIDYSGTESFIVNVQMGDVAETDPAYHNNAKYYAERAREAANEAEDAKDAADEKATLAESYAQNAETSASEAQTAAAQAVAAKNAAEGSADDAADSAEQAHIEYAELTERVNNLSAMGRFLSGWNSDTGEATTQPPESPYTFKTGDYFVISVATDGVTHFKPSGAVYAPSSEVEELSVKPNDIYRYDGTVWNLEINASRDVAFSSLVGDPSDNSALAAALSDKLDKSEAVTPHPQVYAKKENGENVMRYYTHAKLAETFAFRDNDGNIEVGSPVSPDDATPKGFVDLRTDGDIGRKYLYFGATDEVYAMNSPTVGNKTVTTGQRLYCVIPITKKTKIDITAGLYIHLNVSAAQSDLASVSVKAETSIGSSVVQWRTIAYTLSNGINTIGYPLDELATDAEYAAEGDTITLILDFTHVISSFGGFVLVGADTYSNSYIVVNLTGYAVKSADRGDCLYGHAEQRDANGNIIPHGKERIYDLAKNGERKPFSVLFSNGNGDMAVPDARDTSDRSQEAVNIKTLRDLTYRMSLPTAWYNADVIPALRQNGSGANQIALYVRENVGGGFIPKRKNDEGNIPVPLVPRAGNDAASKQYVDDSIAQTRTTIIASNNKTVNGYSVPALTDQQLLTIYNTIVAGKSVSITDATGKVHFSGVTADMVNGDVFVSFLYFDKMILEYGAGNVTNFTALGGGGGSAKGELITSFTFANDQEKFVSLGGEYKRVFIEFYHDSSDYEDEYIFVTTELTLAAMMLSITAPYVPIKFIDHRGWASCLIDVSTGSALMIGAEQSDLTFAEMGLSMATKALEQDSISYVRFIGSSTHYYTATTIPSSISVKIYGVK